MSVIRLAEERDREGISLILNRCNLALPGVDYSKWDGLTVVAEVNGDVVGFTHAVPAKPITFITVLGVLPEYRKTGVGTELLKGMELLLRACGVKAWFAFVGEHRDEALPAIAKWDGILHGGHGQAFVRRF